MNDLERAYAFLDAKQKPYTRLLDYYEGRHPLVYSTDKLCEVFKGLNAHFRQNWMAVVVDAVTDRLSLSHLAIADNEAVEETLADLWNETGIELDEEDIHDIAIAIGEAFVVAGLDDAGQPEAYYNDPRQVHVFYDAAYPRRIAYAAKWWVDDEEKRRLTLFYPDRYEYFISTGKWDTLSSAKGFVPMEEPSAPHAFGRVPIFHFRRKRRRVASEMESVIDLQDAVNKLLSDMMVAAEFGAFQQRYVIANAEIEGQLRNAPNQIWELPEGSSAGEFSRADLTNYLAAIDKLATSIGVITRTPKHYFFTQGGDPSGEALIAMEAPLNKKATRYIKQFAPVWEELAAFLLQLKGVTVASADIKAAYADPHTIQPLTQSIIRQNAVAAGIPLVNVLRDEGWTQKELDELAKDLGEEKASDPAPPLPPPAPIVVQGDSEGRVA